MLESVVSDHQTGDLPEATAPVADRGTIEGQVDQFPGTFTSKEPHPPSGTEHQALLQPWIGFDEANALRSRARDRRGGHTGLRPDLERLGDAGGAVDEVAEHLVIGAASPAWLQLVGVDCWLRERG